MKKYSLESLIEGTEKGIVEWIYDAQLSDGADQSLTTVVNQQLVTLTRNGGSHNVTLESRPSIAVGVIDDTSKTKGETLLDKLWISACKSAGFDPK